MKNDEVLLEKDVPELELTADIITSKSSIIYGGSESGKTHTCLYLLSLMRKHLYMAMVSYGSPDAQNSYVDIIHPMMMFEKFLFPSSKDVIARCSKDRERREAILSERRRFLTQILERQTALVNASKASKNVDVLMGIAKKMTARDIITAVQSVVVWTKQMEKSIHSVRDDPVLSGTEKKDRINEITTTFNNLTVDFLRSFLDAYRVRLLQNEPHLLKTPLTTQEEIVLKLFDIKTEMLLIMDDVSQEITQLSKEEILKDIFSKGRHANMGVIVLSHDPSKIDGLLRRNAHFSFFQTAEMARTFVNGSVMQYSPSDKKRAYQILEHCFKRDRDGKYIFVIWSNDPSGVRFYRCMIPALLEQSSGYILSPQLAEYLELFKAKIERHAGDVDIGKTAIKASTRR